MKRSLTKAVSLVLAILTIAPWLTLCSARTLRPFKSNLVNFRRPYYPQLLVSDFDGDAKSDVVDIASDGPQKNIRIRLSGGSITYLSFDSKIYDRGRLVARDVDHDGDQDLIWYSPADPQDVVVWINDGNGGFGPDTWYKRNDRNLDLDLSPLLDEDSDAGFSGRRQASQLAGPVRSADSLPLNLATGRMSPLRGEAAILEAPSPLVSSLCFTSINKRGPPSCSSFRN